MERGVNEVIVNELSIQFKNLGLIDECINDVKNALVDISKVCKGEQENIDEAYQRGLEEGKKATWELVADASSSEYQRGLEDAWEAAWKIMDIDDFSAMDAGLDTAFNLPVTEAIEKLKIYEEKQKAVGEIKVGDEVIDINGNKTLVTNIHGELYDGLCYDGLTLSDLFLEDVERIGKHYDIDKILEEMKK